MSFVSQTESDFWQKPAVTLSKSDLKELISLCRLTAETEIMPCFRSLSPQEIKTKKSRHDFVTIADERAEAALTEALHQKFPEALIIGEEAVYSNPSLLQGISEAPLAFILDPLDGTGNFVAGIPLFATVIAVTSYGIPIGSVIYDPISGAAFQALAGQGAFSVRQDGLEKRLSVSPKKDLTEFTGCIARNFMPEATGIKIRNRIGRFGAVFDLHSRACEYGLLASGACDFLVFAHLLPWDHAAGVLLHTEAGGYAGHFEPASGLTDLMPYRIGRRNSGLILAADFETCHLLAKTLFGQE